MELERARTLLTELADGVDPLTGECLPSDSVCNRPEIIRALHCVLQHTAGGRKRPSPPNAALKIYSVLTRVLYASTMRETLSATACAPSSGLLAMAFTCA